MKISKYLVLSVLGWISAMGISRAAQSLWEGTEPVLPDQVNPPWTLVTSGPASAYRANDGSPVVAYLISTQAADNVYFEQSGAALQMTNHLVIEAVVRFVSGASGAANRSPAMIAFSTEPNVGGSVWIGFSNLFVTATGDVVGGSTNVDTTTSYHTYRIEVQGTTNGSPYTVYYDGAAVLSSALFDSAVNFGSQPRILWGEGSSVAYGESRWYSFSHNAAAPFTTLTNPAVELACTSTNIPVLPVVTAPFMSLASEGRITNGASPQYANLGLIFNTDDGVIYTGTASGYNPLDTGPRRTFTQSDGSQIMLFEFTDLTIIGVGVRVTGSRAAAILATGDIRLVGGTRLEVDAAGDPGAPAGSEHDAGFNAAAPLGGGGGRGTASAYAAGEPPFLGPGKLPTSGPGGGGFVSGGQDGIPAEPVRMWRYNGPPTFDFTLLGTLFRPGGKGGDHYTNFSVLRGGGAGGSSSGTGFAGNSGFPGGHGGGALFLSATGRILIDSQSSISVDGQTLIGFLSEIAAGGAGGYLVLNANQGIFNQGSLSARGGRGRKTQYTADGITISPWWGSCGDGSGGLIVLKSAAGVTNSGALLVAGGGGEVCTVGVLQTQTPSFVNFPPRLTIPTRSGNQWTFSFTAATNQLYEVQRNDDLNTTNWVTFTNFTGAGFPANIFSPVSGVPKRFFRVRVP
jgi:hypothetical protein